MTPRNTGLWLVALGLCLCPAALAPAQDSWVLTSADLSRQNVKLVGISATEVSVAAGPRDALLALPIGQFVALQRVGVTLPSQQGSWTLMLFGGDRLGGSPDKLDGETLHWNSTSFGKLTIPLGRVEAAVRAGRSPADLDQPRQADTLRLANGDSIGGILIDFTDKAVTLQRGSATSPINLATIDALLLATTAKAPADTRRYFRIALNDGTSIAVSAVEVKDAIAHLTLLDGQKKQVDAAKLILVEQHNGPLAWLSALTPTTARQFPFAAEGAWLPQMDRTVDRTPIRIRGRVYERGIGVRSRTVMTWKLDGANKAFRTQYSIDDSARPAPLADVTVRILLDDVVVHEARNVRAGRIWPVVVVPLASAKTLTLEVDYGDNMDTQDRVVFIEPALLRELPAER